MQTIGGGQSAVIRLSACIATIILVAGCAAPETREAFDARFKESCGYDRPLDGGVVYIKGATEPRPHIVSGIYSVGLKLILVDSNTGDERIIRCVLVTPEKKEEHEFMPISVDQGKAATMKDIAKLRADITMLKAELGVHNQRLNDLESGDVSEWEWRSE